MLTLLPEAAVLHTKLEMRFARLLKMVLVACLIWLPIAIPYLALAYTDVPQASARLAVVPLLGVCWAPLGWRWFWSDRRLQGAARAWRAYKWRLLIGNSSSWILLAAAIGLACRVRDEHHWSGLSLISFLCLLAGSTALRNMALGGFRCPRCGLRFFRSGSLKSKCAHCGLPKWAPEEEVDSLS